MSARPRRVPLLARPAGNKAQLLLDSPELRFHIYWHLNIRGEADQNDDLVADLRGLALMKIAVAMSGGVDSSAAAAILKEQGHELVGFTMQLWDQRRDQRR